MDDTCGYRHRDGQRCVLRVHHALRYHRFANGWTAHITGEESPAPSLEMTAASACDVALKGLPPEQRANVLAFLALRFGNHIASPGLTAQMAGRGMRRIV